MKNIHSDDWLVYGIVLLTSSTTVLTMVDGTLFGLLRGIGFAIVLDGLIIFWESRSESMKAEKQRKNANWMKWAGVGMLLAIAVAYVFIQVVPVDAKKTVDIFGLEFTSTIREIIHWIITGVISGWVVLTLGVVLYVREIDPETKMKLEYTKAAQDRADEKLKAYKVANGYTAGELGKQEALEEYRRDLINANRYTEGEIVAMVMAAGQEIDRRKLVPVGAVGKVNVNAAETVGAANPTIANTNQTRR